MTKILSKHQRSFGILVVLVLVLPFLDGLSKLNVFHEADVIQIQEKEGPFLITNRHTGQVEEVWERPSPFLLQPPIHIIKSRFMQHQGELRALGWARFKLFKFLCFPSMVGQSSQNFFWLIYTDPQLPPALEDAMVQLLQPYRHFYLVKDNTDSRFKGGIDIERLDWEDVVSGDTQRLRYSLQQRDRYPFLETRIDADDGLHANFVEHIQTEAMERLSAHNTHWMFWCISQALEWHWVGECGVSTDQQQYGALLPSREYKNYCHTPGLTLGLFRAGEHADVMSVAHNKLWDTLQQMGTHCGPKTYGTDCISHLHSFQYAALRARTPTSASMVGVNKQPVEFLEEWDEKSVESWGFAKQYFGTDRVSCKRTLEFLQDHMAQILEDAEVGQCTLGHSCRVSACFGVAIVVLFCVLYASFVSVTNTIFGMV
jgi:hypothetical protein